MQNFNLCVDLPSYLPGTRQYSPPHRNRVQILLDLSESVGLETVCV